MNKAGVSRTALPVRVILLTIVVIAVLPPVLYAAFVLNQYSESQRAQAENGLMVSARGVARAVDTQFSSAASTLAVLKNSILLDRGDIEGFTLRLTRTTQESGRAFTLFDASGGKIADSLVAPRTGPAPAELAALFEQARDSRLIVSNVLRDGGSDEAYAYVALPILRNDRLQWVLLTYLYSSQFAEVVESSGVPGDWLVSVVDRNGTHIRRSHLNDKFAGRPLVPVLVDHIAQGGTGIVRTTSLEGIDLISTVAYSPVSGWAAALGLPVATLEAPFRKSLSYLTIMGVAMTVLAAGLAFLVAQILARGFRKLRTSARTLDRGDIIEMEHSRVREVNDIVASMAQVSRNLADRGKALNDLNNSLEAQVAERTAELVAEMQARSETETQLRQLQRIEAIGTLTGGIAHDFNNMLAVVVSALSMMKRSLERGDTDIGQFIDGAMQGAERATSLTRRLLAFSRQQPLNPETVDCNRLITGMADILHRTIPASIEIETVMAAGLWRTHADVSGLENAVLNLVVNARDAMPDGGKLTIECGNVSLDDTYAASHADVTPGQYVMIAVTDTGSGIPPEILENVFEPFFSTKEPGQGTGLGLSQVHGFIKQSGGHVGIYTETGCGTAVKLYLRRVRDDETVREPKLKPRLEIPMARDGETLLVVEDEPLVRMGAVSMLEELGYTVHEAESGLRALDILDGNPAIRLVITDVVMPGMNGRELADEAQRRRPDLMVLYTTGYTRNAIVHNGTLDAGVQLIVKPYSLEILARKVASILYPD